MPKFLCVPIQDTSKPLITDYMVPCVAGTLPKNYKNIKTKLDY